MGSHVGSFMSLCVQPYASNHAKAHLAVLLCKVALCFARTQAMHWQVLASHRRTARMVQGRKKKKR